MTHPIEWWIGFTVFILAMLALDLGVLHRDAHEVRMKEALTWSAAWVALSLLFCGVVYIWKGPPLALQWLTGYLIEKSLSIDNVFVFLLLFTYFRVPARQQHKILFWGILGALVMRAVLVFAGVALIHRFHWVIYVFGAFLVFTGVRMALEKDKQVDPERNPVMRLVRRFLPVAADYEGDGLFTRRAGRVMATPLFVVLLFVETTDLVFAVDSIPAILAVSQDTFIVYTSNVFAILGLRAMYFALAGLMTMFHYLHYGLSAVLVFVGAKMLASGFLDIPTGLALGVIVVALGVSVWASIRWPHPEARIPTSEAG